MLTVPDAVVAEINKLARSGAILELVEIQMSESGETRRLANNNEDVEYGGHTFEKFGFEVGEFKESDEGENTNLSIKFSNVGRILQGYVESAEDGLIGDTVIYRHVDSENLDQDPALYQSFTILSIDMTELTVTGTLGAENLYLKAFPRNRYDANICWYPVFKGTYCQYSGAETECDRTFARCIELGNQARFGGQPGLLGKSFDV